MSQPTSLHFEQLYILLSNSYTSTQKKKNSMALQQKVQQSKYSKRVVLKSIIEREDKGIGLVGERIVVGGWVKSCKEKAKAVVAVTDVASPEVILTRLPIYRFITGILNKKGNPPAIVEKVEEKTKARTLPFVASLKINDGSCVENLQVVVDSSVYPLGQITHVGTSILVQGVIEKIPVSNKHAIELKADKILHVGTVDPEKYPLNKSKSKSKLTMEYIRSFPHLRPRTTMVASITRIRHSLSHATHIFFRQNGFIHVHMPIAIESTKNTNTDCKNFKLISRGGRIIADTYQMKDRQDIDIEVIKAAIKQKITRIDELKRSNSNKEVLINAIKDLQKASELALQLEEQNKINSGKNRMFKTCTSDLSELYLESYACALGNVYTFGPTLQANKYVDSTENLEEKWTIEAALAFAELEDAMNCAEDCLKFLCQTIVETCSKDIKFMSKRITEHGTEHFKSVVSSPFKKITYTDALELIKKAKNQNFNTVIEWGISLSKEHEKYLADEIFKQPMIIYDYPKGVKPFNVRLSDDEKTAFAFNIIAPKVGVLVQGSQKEERITKMGERIQELGLPYYQYDAYLDLRRHGTVKHSGFNVAFEELVMFATGVDDIRDVVSFPKSQDRATSQDFEENHVQS